MRNAVIGEVTDIMFTNTKESGLESLIVKWLVEHNGYEQGHNHDYSMVYALDTVRLFRFLKDTQPDAVDKLQLETNPQKKAQFLSRVRDEITKRGIIDVLRKGVKAYPASLVMFYMTPSINNPAAAELYAKNIFSVTRQLHFSPDETKLSLDLCVFINGLPVITFELKNQLTIPTEKSYGLALAPAIRCVAGLISGSFACSL